MIGCLILGALGFLVMDVIKNVHVTYYEKPIIWYKWVGVIDPNDNRTNKNPKHTIGPIEIQFLNGEI